MGSFSCSLIVFLAAVAVTLADTMCTPEEITEENLRKLADANNIMALNVHRLLASRSSENIFFSPLSLSTAFGMLYYGAKGETAEELRNVLGYEEANIPEELVHCTFHRYLTEALLNQDSSAYVLNLANSILLDEKLDIKPSYKTEVQDLYLASVKDVDFETENEEVVKEVNNWVSEKTNNTINKLLDELDRSTSLVILNAVYFKGTWKTQFDPEDTTSTNFYNNGLESDVKKVPMMSLKEELPFTYLDEDAKVVEIPYEGENISMLLVVPFERNGLEDIERNLTLETLTSIRQKMRSRKVNVFLPRFKIEYSAEMSGDFRSLGARSIFAPGGDLSGLTSSKDVFVSEVLHKAVLEVNEAGSEAAAVTGLISMRTMEYEIVYTNRPFLFAIIDNRNDMILLMGRVSSL